MDSLILVDPQVCSDSSNVILSSLHILDEGKKSYLFRWFMLLLRPPNSMVIGHVEQVWWIKFTLTLYLSHKFSQRCKNMSLRCTLYDKCLFKPSRVNDRGSVSLMVCRKHIRASNGAFQIFVVNSSMGKLMSVKFLTIVFHFRSNFKGFYMCHGSRASNISPMLNHQ